MRKHRQVYRSDRQIRGGRKLKEVPTATWHALQSALRRRILSGHKHAAGLLDVLSATLLTGLRPNEWSSAYVTSHPESGREALVVKNSKHSNGRANGEFRAMFIDELTEDERNAVVAAISYCKSSNDNEASRIQLALKQELEAARDQIIIKSKHQNSSVTLYSFRHQFIANAKEAFDDPVLVAALAGHNSTKTAFQHYGKRRNNTGKVMVSPTPESVATVQAVSLQSYKDYVSHRRQFARNDHSPE